jgi:phage shock protein E
MKFSKRSAAALVAVATLAIAGCSSDTDSSEATVQPTDATTQEQGTSSQVTQVVDAEQFASVVEQPDVVVLDVRTPAEFNDGHIEGAVNIDVNGPTFADEIALLDPSGTYAVYCRSGNRSAVAVQHMATQGFTSLYDLAGGAVSWQAAGYDLV